MNIAGFLMITVWTVGLCSIMFGLLKLFGLLRVDRNSEIVGMDIVKHGEPAYPVSAYGGDYRQMLDKGGKSGPLAHGGVPIVMPSLKADFTTGQKPQENGNANDAFKADEAV